MKIITTIILLGTASFVTIVAFLQTTQSHYDPTNQYMSELASGEYGSWMIAAFLGLGLSMLAAAAKFRVKGAPWYLQILLVIASILFMGAGIVTLETNALVHILMVFGSFGLFIIGVLLASLLWLAFWNKQYRIFTYASAGITIVSMVIGLPDGLAQRGAAGGIIFWLIWFGLDKMDAQPIVPGDRK